MSHRWLEPISTRINSPMRHLVPTEGWLVPAACGRLVNLRFAKPSNARKCRICERRGTDQPGDITTMSGVLETPRAAARRRGHQDRRATGVTVASRRTGGSEF